MALPARTAPINLRARPTERRLIDRACEILSKTRSDFMLETACREAENVLLDQRLFKLDSEAYSAFEAAINAPINENPALQALMSNTAPWEK
jgi:uncharacterized protein (DUF1778 family)